MKRSLLLIANIALSISVFSQQQIGNSNMESWDNIGSSTEEPVNWNSFMTAQGGLTWAAAKQCERSSTVRPGSTGSYSARVYSRSAAFGIVANGNLTLGRINMGNSTATSSSNYNISLTSDAGFSEALTGMPDSLVFWVRYSGSSTPRVSAVLHDTYDYRDGYVVDNNSLAHKVAEISHNFSSPNGQWVRKSLPWNYTGPASMNTFIIVTFTTNSTPGGGAATDEILIDDIELIYNPVNQAVVANDDIVSTFQDTPINISVLNNDTDPENDFNISSLNITSNPTNGVLNVNTLTGEITYTPNAGYSGNDTFEYEICDNGTPIYCDIATVNITVIEVIVGNNPIIANDDVAITDMNVPVTTNVLANDQDFENQIDNTTLIVTVQPTNGTTSVNQLTGEITYTPNLDFFSNDSYTYSICDAGTPAISCDQAVVNVTVNLTWGVGEVSDELLKILVFGNEISILGENLEGNYTIYNLNGTLVQKGTIQPKIQLQNTTGIYFLQIDSNKGSITKKIVIQ